MSFIFLLLIIVLDKDVFLFYLPLKTNNIGTKNKEKPLETSVSNGFLASQEGFEPPTVRLEGGCSIQLSYYDKSATNNIIEKGAPNVNRFSLFLPTFFKMTRYSLVVATST